MTVLHLDLPIRNKMVELLAKIVPHLLSWGQEDCAISTLVRNIIDLTYLASSELA